MMCQGGNSTWDIIVSFCVISYRAGGLLSHDNVIYFTGLANGEKIKNGKLFVL